MASLPPEILLNIIPYVSYSPQALLSLRLIDRKLNHLIKSHETSLVSAIKHHQPSLRAQSRLFPDHALTTYTALSHLHARLSTLTEINALWLTITSHGMELHWLKGRWERIHKAGLLLLYRLHDCGPSHAAKLALLHHRLPATSLACLLFKLISSIKVLRVYGPTPIHARTGENGAWCCHHQDRNDVELACEEMLLREGPDFFVALLKAGRTEGESGGWAVTYVYTLPPFILCLAITPVPPGRKQTLTDIPFPPQRSRNRDPEPTRAPNASAVRLPAAPDAARESAPRAGGEDGVRARADGEQDVGGFVVDGV